MMEESEYEATYARRCQRYLAGLIFLGCFLRGRSFVADLLASLGLWSSLDSSCEETRCHALSHGSHG